MPWLKAGDNAATHPSVMAVQADAAREPGLVNEVFGFVMRCALQSAGHMTDYKVDVGTAAMLGGPRWERLLKVAVSHGLLTVHGKGKHRTWRLVEDDEFFHIRRRAEVEWERQRQRDNRNPALTCPVRLRDGDACRYCGRVVNWRDRKGNRGGTYDHLNPDEPTTTVDLLVVACFTCNTRRGGGEPLELKPAPANPIYGPDTVKFLTNNDYPAPTTGVVHGAPVTEVSELVPQTGGSRLDDATPAAGRETATDQAPSWATDSDPAPSGIPRPGASDPTDGGITRATSISDPAPSGIPRPGASDPTDGGITRATSISDPAPSGFTRSATPHPAGSRDTTEYEPTPGALAPPGDPPPDPPGSGRSGRSEVYHPGRDGYGSGPGRAGPGRVWSGAPPDHSSAGRRRRSRRGGG